jgi:hypothetical protein
MRGYDGESARPELKLDLEAVEPVPLEAISETGELMEMSGGIAEDEEIRSPDHESESDSASYLAASGIVPLQLNVCTTPEKYMAEQAILEVRSIIESSGNNRTWVMNMEEICRTECCRYKRMGNEGVSQDYVI